MHQSGAFQSHSGPLGGSPALSTPGLPLRRRALVHQFWQDRNIAKAPSPTLEPREMALKAGRVVIPKPLREELHLEPGDALVMEHVGEQILLRPARGTGPLTKEHGVWVFYSGEPLPASATEAMLRKIRLGEPRRPMKARHLGAHRISRQCSLSAACANVSPSSRAHRRAEAEKRRRPPRKLIANC